MGLRHARRDTIARLLQWGRVSTLFRHLSKEGFMFKRKEDEHMKTLLTRFVKEEEGQGMVEYGLIIGLIAVVLITALTLMQGGLSNIFKTISDKLMGTGPA